MQEETLEFFTGKTSKSLQHELSATCDHGLVLSGATTSPIYKYDVADSTQGHVDVSVSSVDNNIESQQFSDSRVSASKDVENMLISFEGSLTLVGSSGNVGAC